MSSKKETRTNVTTKTDPWEPAIPGLNQSIRGVNELYKSDYGRDFFPDATYVPASDATTNALNRIEQRATDGSALNQNAQNSLLNYINGDRSNPANDFYQGGINGDLNVSTDNYNRFLNDSQNPANNYFNDIAGGNNPYIDAQFTRAADKVSDQVNSLFSKAGRYGSTAHQGKLTDDLGAMANDFYGNQYNADMNRRMSAANALSNDYNTNIGQQMNAAGSIANIEGANAANKLNAANAYSNNANIQDSKQLQSIAMANGVANSDYHDLDRLLGVGAAREGYDREALNDAINRFNFEEFNPIEREKVFAQLAGYFGSLGSTQNTKGITTEKTSGLGSAIGNIGAGLGLAGSIAPTNWFGGGSPAQMAMTTPQAASGGAFNAFQGYTPYYPYQFY